MILEDSKSNTKSTKMAVIAEIALVLSFTLLFVAYQPNEVSSSLLIVALIPTAVVGLYAWLRGAVRGQFFGSAGPLEAVRLIVVPLIPVIVSTLRGDEYGTTYGLIIISWVLVSRMLWDVISLENVIRAAAITASVWVAAFLWIGWSAILGSITLGARMEIAGFHPNTVGFTMAGLTPALVWWFRTSRNLLWRAIALASLAIAGALVVLASSRGSLVAIASALTVCLFLMIAKACRDRPLRMQLVLVCFCLMAAMVVVEIGVGGFATANDQFRILLELDSPYRGLDSGVSGRFEIWGDVLALLRGGAWLAGSGYRSGIRLIGAEIDNGYLTVWLEMGVLGLCVVLFRYLSILRSALSSYWSDRGPAQTALCICAFLVVVLVNNVFARYLFGMGNPVSLLALFLYAGPPRLLKGASGPPQMAEAHHRAELLRIVPPFNARQLTR
jgi:O-antigen ligase